MDELQNERDEQLKGVFARYAIKSIDDCKAICSEKKLDVDSVILAIKPDINETARLAFIVGSAIAIKRDTKLASYVAYDFGEAIQTLCEPGSEAQVRKAGEGIGMQASNKIKGITDQIDLVEYSSMLDFMGMTKDELLNIIIRLSKIIEELMK